jgi:hypothetical protein
MAFLGGDPPEQAYLLPADARDWLPAGHLAWAVLGLAREMDLSAFTGWFRADGQGRPAYDPAMMVGLACYCYCKGIWSSRAIEAATFDDLGARVICGNLLAALDHDRGVVLGQVDVQAKTNEIPLFATLLDRIDLAGAVVTADALHAQTAHAQYLAGQRRAHYLITVPSRTPPRPSRSCAAVAG